MQEKHVRKHVILIEMVLNVLRLVQQIHLQMILLNIVLVVLQTVIHVQLKMYVPYVKSHINW